MNHINRYYIIFLSKPVLLFIFLYMNISTIADDSKSPVKSSGPKLKIGCLPHYMNTMRDLTRKAAQAENSVTEIQITKYTNEAGVKELDKGNIDIFVTDTKPTGFSKMKYVIYELGTYPVHFIANINNPVDGISTAQLKKIYLYEIKNWSELGGNNALINIYDLEADSIEAALLGRSSITEDYATKKLKLGTEKEIVIITASDKNAFGCVNMTNFRSKNVKALKIDDVEPTDENIKSGKYKYAVNVVMLTRSTPSEKIKNYADFLAGKDCEKVLRKAGIQK